MTTIWNGASTTPAATHRVPVDVSSSGGPTRWTGQQIADLRAYVGGTVNNLGSIGTNQSLSLADGLYIAATITGNVQFTFTSVPTGFTDLFLELTNAGAHTVSFAATIGWTGGTTPSLPAVGVALIHLYTRDGGTSYIAHLVSDEQQFDAAAIISGTVATARLGSGTANSTTVLRGDQTWGAPPAGGSSGQFQFNDASAFGGANLWREDANTVAQRNGNTAQVAYYYRDATDTSNYERLAILPGAAAGWMQIVAQTAGIGADNFGVALTPAGTGALSAHVPNSATTGGNARGANSTDWQTSRTAANQVASGNNAVIAGGGRNIASGNYSTIAGGDQNTSGVSGDYTAVGGGLFNSATERSATVAGGENNTASGKMSWVPGGTRATTRGLYGAGAYASGRRSADGDAQVMCQVVRRTTTDATPVNLATDGTPAATTVMVLPSDSVATVVATVTAIVNAAGVISMAGWEIKAVAKNDSSTMTLTGGTATAIGTADAALATATCALVVDGTRDSVEVQVTGVAATTIYWVAEVKIVQAL